MSDSSSPNPCPCTKNKWLFLGIGAVGLAIAYLGVFVKGLGAVHSTDAAVHAMAFRPMISMIVGSAFWLTVLIGMLYLTMITRIFDGGWAPVIRRQWENFMGALPFVLLLGLFIPLVAHPEIRKTVLVWMNPEYKLSNGHEVGHDSVLAAKSWFLNEQFFFIRCAIYLLVLTVVPYLFRRWSYAQDRDPQLSYTTKAHSLSVGSMLFLSLVVTGLAIDFIMALSYHWFSTMFGVWFFTAAMRASLAFTVLICSALAYKGWLRGLFHRAHRHLLGCMMLAFTVFWAYISFSQYFIIYNGNIPEETFWYNMREIVPHVIGQTGKNQWWWVSMGLVFLYFVGPFLALLFYKAKVNTKLICAISTWTLITGFLDLYWNIVPRQVVTTGAAQGYVVNPFLDANMLYDLAAVIGLGGVVMFVFLHSASKVRPIPVHDPRILESVSYHE